MAYTAPDPEQFSGMEEAYSYLMPIAAVNITLPAYVFRGPVVKLSRLIYLNQCNPGEIMKGGAYWLQIAQKYSEAKEKLEELVNAVAAEDWEGDDRKAFQEKVDKILGQLEVIQAFATQIGISLMTIATMLAVMVPIMVTVATVLMGLAVTYLIVRSFVPAGPVMAMAWHATAMTFSATTLAALKVMDTANATVAKGLAAFIGANMTISWGVMAAKGNIISPASTIGSTGYSLLQGLAQLAFVRLMAPGHGAGGALGKFSPGAASMWGKSNVGLMGAAGGQGVYSIGNNAAGEDAPNKMTDAGVDAGLYDFIPDTFEDQARAGDTAPDWAGDGATETGDGSQTDAGR